MAGTKGEEWRAGRQRATATQRPQCLPLLPPGTDINNMYIYLYIYIYIYQRAGGGRPGATRFPKGPGMAEACSCGGWGAQRHTREWPRLTDTG